MVLSAGCGQESGGSAFRALLPGASRGFGSSRPAASIQGLSDELMGNGKITHVVIIFQENRTTDNLFNGLPGADTVRRGKNSRGQIVDLRPTLLTAPYDVSHKHRAFNTEYANGMVNGFNDVVTVCKKLQHCPPPELRAYGYVPRHEVEPYFIMAERYTFADRMFQTNEGPSFPAHQYILSGTSAISNGSSLRAAENPYTPEGKLTGGCDSPAGSNVWLIDAAGDEDRTVYPCFERRTLMDLLEKNGLTWHYYQEHIKPGLWNGPDAILHIRKSHEYFANVVAPSSQVLTDVVRGNLANVVWVIPDAKASDHAALTDGSGPSWVASIVNAVGNSKYWNHTAIFVTWDDWGGWYDHVKPPRHNSYELSFRVPLIVISPYARGHYVSHREHEFGSILKFTEKAFGLGSLGTTDVRSDDLADCFNFLQRPRAFKKIPALLSPAYFSSQPISNQDPDDDF
jgi:phospholipase C